MTVVLSDILLSGDRRLCFTRTLVMGILNVTPDSFSDGGRYALADQAVARAVAMVDEGADIIDIGGESSRPGAEPVPGSEEINRVIPVIREIREVSPIPISIDTTKAQVAGAALEAGADIVNDISAGRFDPQMLPLVAKNQAPYIMMHMLGEPRTMQVSPTYQDCVAEIMAFFEKRLAAAEQAGVERSRIIIDPGIGFGKRLQDNVAILRNLSHIVSLGQPLLIGTSRKSFLGKLTGRQTKPTERLAGSLSSALLAVARGAHIIRVHDVRETVDALAVMRGLEQEP